MNHDRCISGIIAGTTAVALTHPIDTLKIHYQIGKNSRLPTKFGSLYRGVLVNSLSVASFYGTFFPTYALIKSQLEKRDIKAVNTINMLAGYTSSVLASLLGYPFHLIKIRQQSLTLPNNKNYTIPRIIGSIYLRDGIPGFWRGSSFALLRNFDYAIQLPNYEYMKNRSNNPTYSAFTSKFITSTILYPIDISCTLAINSTKFKHVETFISMSNFYRGYLMYVSRSIPATIVAFNIYEYLQKNRISNILSHGED